MSLDRIIYKCKNCGWNKSITAAWPDIKPDYCGNGRCDYSKGKSFRTKLSFRKEPETLEVIKPKSEEQNKEVKQVVRTRPPREKKNGKQGRPRKGSGKKTS